RAFSGLLLAGLTSILWAGNSIAVKYGASGLDVARANAVRYCFGLGILAATVRTRGMALSPSPRQWRALLPAIVADGVFGSTFYVYGLAHSDLAIGATLTSL